MASDDPVTQQLTALYIRVRRSGNAFELYGARLWQNAVVASHPAVDMNHPTSMEEASASDRSRAVRAWPSLEPSAPWRISS